MKLVLLGPPGAGKGTQAAVVSKAYRLRHLSTGDMLRGEVAAGSQLGASIADLMQAGGRRLELPDTAGGFLLDGYPRTVFQAEALSTMLGMANLDLVLELVVNPEALSDRIQRRVAESLAAGNPVRTDDDTETLRKQLLIYNSETAQLADYYRRKGLLFRVNGDASVADVSRDILGRVAHLRS